MDSATSSERPKIPNGFPKSIHEWTEEHVAAFLAENGVRNNGYMEIVQREAIDGEALLYSSAVDYERWSIPGAQANKIVRLANNLNKGKGLPMSTPETSLKRDLEEEQGPEIYIRKRPKTRNWDAYFMLRQAIRDVRPNDFNDYTNPAKIITLPFPYRGSQYPCEGFHFTPNREFNYMGRREFKRLADEIIRLYNTRYHELYHELYLYGTTGYGKSYLLAAMVCSLIQRRKRVVYFPDCRALLDNPFQYIQDALFLAFADRESYQELTASCKSLGDLADLFERLANKGYCFLFIIDQYDALDPRDGECNNMKEKVNSELRRMVYRHHVIKGTSGNCQPAIHFEQKQANNIKRAVCGGLTEEEMECWYEHYKDMLPEFILGDKAKFEDLTGRVPLLLYGLVREDFHGRLYHDVEKDFLSTKAIVDTLDRAVLFAEKMKHKGGLYWQRYCDLTVACCTDQGVLPGYTRDYDCRFFYVDDDGIGHSTCGLIREAVLKAL